MPEYEKETTEQQRLEKEQLEDLGTVWRTRGPHAIHCLTVIGQIEGHVEAPQGQKTTKYEHVIPQLVAVQEDPAVEGLLVLINTVGGLVALFNPTGVRSTAFIIIGITSLVYAVSELINWFKFTRLRPKAPVTGSKSDDDIEDAKIIE